MAMRERAQALADANVDAAGQDCYVFFSCENGNVDPTLPQKSWRTSWRRLTKNAGLPGLRFHDLKHASVTQLAESGLSDQTIMSIAGHVSQRMLAHYSHIRMAAKRESVDILGGKRKSEAVSETAQEQPREESYDTNDDTNQPAEQPTSLQPVEK